MDLNKVVMHSDLTVASDSEMPRRQSSVKRTNSRGLICRKGIWHIEGEASFAFWNAVDPSMEAPGETSCFARSRKQMERFTVVLDDELTIVILTNQGNCDPQRIVDEVAGIYFAKKRGP